MKAYLASHCPFQGEGKKRIGLLISLAVVRSRRQYFFSNFQWQIFFLNVVSEYCCCLLAYCETWRSHLSTPCTVCSQYPAFPLGEAQEGRGESSFQGSACPTKKAQLNADRNKSCSRKDVLSSIPSERTEWAGFDRARRESGSSKLDRNFGSYFLPTFGGSQLLSYLEPSQKHAYPAVQSCFSQPL